MEVAVDQRHDANQTAVSRWYAVATKVSQENRAVEHLLRQNYEIFLPKAFTTKRVGSRLINRSVAFFPGYLFVRFNIDRNGWRAINCTRGVRSLVMTGDRPASLPMGFIESLRAATRCDGVLSTKFDFQIGDSVRIVAGPLTSFVGTLTRMESRQRVLLLVSMLSGKVPITIETSNIAPALQKGTD